MTHNLNVSEKEFNSLCSIIELARLHYNEWDDEKKLLNIYGFIGYYKKLRNKSTRKRVFERLLIVSEVSVNAHDFFMGLLKRGDIIFDGEETSDGSKGGR